MAHFTSDFNQFYKDLAKNNNKEWFDANRKRYEMSVKKPFLDLVSAVIAKVGKVDKNVRIEAKEAIFRINRDIRFSKDKTPYKLSSSAIISPAGRKDHSIPGLYFEMGPECVRIFGGAYMPDKTQLGRIRAAIVNDPKGFRKVIGSKHFTTLFGEVRGEKNKVLPTEFKTAAIKEPLVANKQFYAMAELPASTVTDAKLLDRVMEHHKAVHPFNTWLATAMGYE